MKITFHGVRGSYPVPGENTVKYGGNTTCISITSESEKESTRLIIDSGTGVIPLGKEIVGRHFQGKESLGNMHMLFTHLHPDHTQGFPFFAPNFFPECKIKLYGMKTLKKHVGKVLELSMLPPNFPIEYGELKSAREHIILRDGNILNIGPFQIKIMQAFAPSHPQQGCLYYRIEDESGKSVACIWDNESKVGGDRAVMKFAQGADLMIHDTQFLPEEYVSDKMIVQGWGHSTYEMAIENFKGAEAGMLACMHFNPAHTDDILEKTENRFGSDTIIMAKEGLTITL